MKVIKRPDYSNGVLSLSSKPLRMHHAARRRHQQSVPTVSAELNPNVMPHRASDRFCNSAYLRKRPETRIPARDHYATDAIPHRHTGGNDLNVERKKEELSFQQNIPGDFPARPKWLLRFPVQLCFDAPGIS
jgi:hypothetical protein